MISTTIERLRPAPVTPDTIWSATTLSSIVHGQHLGPKRNETAQPGGRRGRLGLRDSRWSVLGAVAATLAAVFCVHSVWPTPAFAVTGRDDEVEVRVNRLEGADALEKALGKQGIKADITYLAVGQHCASGRYRKVPMPDDMIVAINVASFLIIIPKGAVDTDDTFVVSAWIAAEIGGGVALDVDSGIARGAVAPCTVVPAR